MDINFNGKTALVTGASKGFGREIAKKLAECGAKVIAVARTKELLETLKNEINSIEILELDITDWKQTETKLNQVGPIDLLVNNAGQGWIKSMLEIEEEDFYKIFNVNTKALINITRIVVNNLKERNANGSIVNISSQASIAGLMEHTIYCASKGAVDAFTRACALECGPYNIRVNAINPTVILTEMGRLWWSDPKVAKPMLDKIPLNRFGEVEDVVNAVLFLLSDKSNMITGTSLPLDGGFLAT